MLCCYARQLRPKKCAGAEPERVIREIEEIIGLDCSNIIHASAKMGLGIEETLEAVVKRIPPPKNTTQVGTETQWKRGWSCCDGCERELS